MSSKINRQALSSSSVLFLLSFIDLAISLNKTVEHSEGSDNQPAAK
jgi:hypothetical protein